MMKERVTTPNIINDIIKDKKVESVTVGDPFSDVKFTTIRFTDGSVLYIYGASLGKLEYRYWYA